MYYILFFSPFTVVRPTQIFGLFKKKKNVTTQLHHFSLEIILLIWTMSIVKQHKEKQEQKHEHFSQYIVHFFNPNMWTLTFNVFLAYQGLLFRDFLWFFFFFSVRPTQYQETHSTVNKERRGDGLIMIKIWPVCIKGSPKKSKSYIFPR